MATTQQRQPMIPDYIDEAAQSSPSDTWAIVPRSSTSVHEGWHHYTYADLARAVDSLAWWIEKRVGVAQHPGQTIGYMGYVRSAIYGSCVLT
jgi:acyl-CoA synthetase (AMP-forming)/AMP-acid ligase II